MSSKFLTPKNACAAAALFAATLSANADSLTGQITDQQSGEPLIGALVQIAGTKQGALTDTEGRFKLTVSRGRYNFVVKYLGYQSLTINDLAINGDTTCNFTLSMSETALEEAVVRVQRTGETEQALLTQRQKATVAVESISLKEMSVKGLSTVEDGVKKISGISTAEAGQIIVRGLGDRYSATTLNGQPIASPNPDNKLIPLNLFPSDVVQNITVKKVYDPEEYADYSGAHINISTRNYSAKNFVNISVNAGYRAGTTGRDFWQMNQNGSLFSNRSLPGAVKSMSRTEFADYARQNDPFGSSFALKNRTALPDGSVRLAFGRNIALGEGTLNLLGSGSLGSSRQTMRDAYMRTINTNGDDLDNFSYDSYENAMKAAALAYAGYTFASGSRVGYTYFFARNASDTYSLRQGTDAEGYKLTGSQSTTHIYGLQMHQLNGTLKFGAEQRGEVGLAASYGTTGSHEPDRRQAMFVNNNGALQFFKLNKQETARYFGELEENEKNMQADFKWRFGEKNVVRAGAAYKTKRRDYEGIRFYYDVNNIDATFSSPAEAADLLNTASIANGTVSLQRYMYPYEAYKAESEIVAAHAGVDLYPLPSLLVSPGLRFESGRQSVRYADDGGDRYSQRRELKSNDIFPALNMKLTLNKANSLRFAASRTTTRPSFVEMAPFLYQESYGSAMVRGNASLVNAYNYNFDLRFERISETGDMLSLTGYFKWLDRPIERTQTLNGGAAVHSFANAESGLAGGVELEVRKTIVSSLRCGLNVSYMYTNVKLPEAGAYTNKERALQGASPVLLNADLTYAPRFARGGGLSLALLYNLQGSRIQSVGIAGLGDVEQKAVHTLNFAASYDVNERLQLKLQADNLLNQAERYVQSAPAAEKEIEVERYKKGTAFEIGASYRF